MENQIKKPIACVSPPPPFLGNIALYQRYFPNNPNTIDWRVGTWGSHPPGNFQPMGNTYVQLRHVAVKNTLPFCIIEIKKSREFYATLVDR